MTHQDCVELIRNGIHNRTGKWADFGSGRGSFTLALAELLDPKAVIYSIDKDKSALHQQKKKMNQYTSTPEIHFIRQDFRNHLTLPPLDGIVMANSLHYIKDQEVFVRNLQGYLNREGRLILIEYNISRGTSWVPYPLPFEQWKNLSVQWGFGKTELLKTRPSRFHGEMYAAVSYY